ncbi:right-handed parallel beta-helix repeat-containing protein [Saccharibacillus sp. CPCC 101409]|uniref:right-handed parallel beta-helix repeat-containing protein n=1 Tax=Saccharibacillus sp. CPCC 101409 TaxID=3058041 RepID=UPI002673D44F|nr:right-handed parallel beta-helix repeat-containing protein [Saccharibacillus sp. CPCC 101409]MDO3411668.1 right-handed parallel beta-helix repeat-containing protein [Saccharibacillus sp. CPCC 101409]
MNNKPAEEAGEEAVKQTEPVPIPEDAISVADSGATADDDTDDFDAIQSAIDQAAESGKAVYVPAGNYRLSKILVVKGVSLLGDGADQSILTSTNPENGSIDIEGDGVVLSGFAHVYETTVERGDGANDKNSITVRGATNFKIQNIRIDKSSTAGIFVGYQSKDGVIQSNVLERTGADGIHITDGSSGILVENNTVKEAGDDTIAVVSYEENPATSSDVTIRGNDVGYNSKARGISVVGGENVKIENNRIYNTEMAGIYISVEKEWETRNVKNITVTGNTVDHTGTRLTAEHPNVLVYASQGKIDEVTFNNNTITDSVHGGIGVWGSGDIGNIYFDANKLENTQGLATNFKSGKIHSEDNIGF